MEDVPISARDDLSSVEYVYFYPPDTQKANYVNSPLKESLTDLSAFMSAILISIFGSLKNLIKTYCPVIIF